MLTTSNFEALKAYGWTVTVKPAFDDLVDVALLKGEGQWIDQRTVHYTNVAVTVDIMIEDANR